jgi:ribonuclease E
LQAAFVNFGRERHGFLAFNDIQSDYYQLPLKIKKKLRIAEEKIREELKDKTIEDNQDNSQSEINLKMKIKMKKNNQMKKKIKNKNIEKK